MRPRTSPCPNASTYRKNASKREREDGEENAGKRQKTRHSKHASTIGEAGTNTERGDRSREARLVATATTPRNHEYGTREKDQKDASPSNKRLHSRDGRAEHHQQIDDKESLRSRRGRIDTGAKEAGAPTIGHHACTISTHHIISPLKPITPRDLLRRGEDKERSRDGISNPTAGVHIPDPLQHTMRRGVEEILGDLWAQSTWSRKRSVWKQYEKFHREIKGTWPEEVQEETAMLFVSKTKRRLGATSAREYGADLLAIQDKLKPDLASLVKALTAANVATGKTAVTMEPETLVKFLVKLEIPERRTLWLQWMTASRWSDVAGRTSGLKLVAINKSEVAVLFGQTKALRRGQAREDHQVVVKRLPELPDFFRMPLDGPRSAWSTTRMDSWMPLDRSGAENRRGALAAAEFSACAKPSGHRKEAPS